MPSMFNNNDAVVFDNAKMRHICSEHSTPQENSELHARIGFHGVVTVREQQTKSEELGKQAAVPKLKDTSFCGGHLVRTSKVATAKSVTYKLTIPKFAEKSTVLLYPVVAECVIALEILKEEARNGIMMGLPDFLTPENKNISPDPDLVEAPDKSEEEEEEEDSAGNHTGQKDEDEDDGDSTESQLSTDDAQEFSTESSDGKIYDEEYTEESTMTLKQKSNFVPILFTTGLGFSTDDKSRLSTVQESASSRQVISESYSPDPSLYGLVIRWSRKQKYHFAADVLNSNFVVARELGLSSPFNLCQLRGWILTRCLKLDASGRVPFRIEYKRFHECLLNAKFPPGHAALSLNGIVQSVYHRLETNVLPPDTTAPPAGPASTKKTPQTRTATMKRKNIKASADFELIRAHDPRSFQQRLTQNTKCLQIGLFLMDFIFGRSAPVEVSARTKFYFAMFSGCYSSHRFVELCHGLLVMFDGPTPDQGKVDQLSARVLAPGSNLTLSDYVFGQVSFGPARTHSLANKINEEIDRRFPSTSVKKYTNRDTSDQLAIMRFVVLTMFMKYTGNVIDPSKSSPS